MMRICSVTDLGLLSPDKRFSRSTTRASSLPMVSFRPDMISSVMGAIVIERGEATLKGVEEERLQRLGKERLEDGEMEKWRTGREGILAPEVRSPATGLQLKPTSAIASTTE